MSNRDYTGLINKARNKFSSGWPEEVTNDAVVEALRAENGTEFSRQEVFCIALKAEREAAAAEREAAAAALKAEREAAAAALKAAREAAREEGLEEGKRQAIRLRTDHRGKFVPPKVMNSVSPSSLESNKSIKRQFHNEIMDIEINHGAFILVPAYLAFVKGAYAAEQAGKCLARSKTLFNFRPWCPRDSDWEEQRSTAIADWLGQELLASCDFSNLDYGVSVTHQLPVLPKTKAQKQTVDVGVLVWKADDMEAIPAVMIEHKVNQLFGSYESQSSMYATDCQNITERSVILIQTRGSNLDNLEFVVYGIMNHWGRRVQKPTHFRTLLLECKGEYGLRQIASGLRSFFPALLKEEKRENNGHVLSAVCARHDVRVYKSFDYRYRTVARKRNPHLDLYKELVSESSLFEINQEDLHILSMPHFEIEHGKQQYGPVKGKNLYSITTKVLRLHEKELVHGDIRLANMLPHHGLLLDFDYTAKAGTCYPDGFLHIGWDGRRAQAVAKAINAGKVGKLGMAYDHDIESLYFVLRLYGAENSTVQDKWKDLVNSSPLLPLPMLLEKMGKLADDVFNLDVEYLSDELGTGGTPDAKIGSKAKRIKPQNESSCESVTGSCPRVA